MMTIENKMKMKIIYTIVLAGQLSLTHFHCTFLYILILLFYYSHLRFLYFLESFNTFFPILLYIICTVPLSGLLSTITVIVPQHYFRETGQRVKILSICRWIYHREKNCFFECALYRP